MEKYFKFDELNDDKVMSLYSKKPMNFHFSADRDTYFKEIENDFNYKIKFLKRSEYQAHGKDVVIIDESNVNDEFTNVDGLITNLKDVALEIRTADCQSIFLYDRKKKVIGNIHSGWKGTYQQIIIHAINLMMDRFGCKVEDIEVYINPSICGECFEVQDDVIDKFKEICDVDKYIKSTKVVDGVKKYYLDTVMINYDKLVSKGISKDNIHLSNICNCCHRDEYYSYRGDKKTDGRNISLIVLKK